MKLNLFKLGKKFMEIFHYFHRSDNEYVLKDIEKFSKDNSDFQITVYANADSLNIQKIKQ